MSTEQQQLEIAIAALESQRALLGDAVPRRPRSSRHLPDM